VAQQDAQKLFNAFAGQARDFYGGFVERICAAYAAERVHDGVFGKHAFIGLLAGCRRACPVTRGA